MAYIKITRDANGDLHFVDPSNGTDLAVFRQSTHDMYFPQGEARGRTPVTLNYTMVQGDRHICYTALAAARTVTLLAAASVTNKIVTVKDEAAAAGTNNITVQVAGGGTIDGASTSVINTNNGFKTYYSNGTQWLTT